MNFFKRATTSIVRRLGKTITLLLLVFILGSVITGAISVTVAINNTDANLRRNMQPIVSIDMDWQSWNEYWMEWVENDDFDWDNFSWENADINDPSTFPSARPQLSLLTASDVRAIGALEYVDNFAYTIIATLESFDLDRYRGTTDWGFEEGELGWFDVRGTSTPNLVQIDHGTLGLVQGNQFSQNDLIPGQAQSVAIISEAFAQTNDLTIGSILSLYNFVMYPDEYGNITGWGRIEDDIYARIGMEFEVIGLFDVFVDIDPDAEPDPWGLCPRMDQINGIYIPNWVIEDISTRTSAAHLSVWDSADMEVPFWVIWDLQDEREASVTSLFVLEDSADIDNFKVAAADLLPEYHYFVDLSNAFSDIASSMETMQNIADWTLYVSIGAMLLILSLLIILFLHDRRYEMGVYLALGEKKGRIISQVLIEVAAISFVAITLAIFSGHFISSTVSQNMLRNELIAQYEQNRDDAIFGEGERTNFDRIGITTTTMTPEEMMEAFEVSLSVQTICLFFAIGMGTVFISTILPLIHIIRLEPKEILTDN